MPKDSETKRRIRGRTSPTRPAVGLKPRGIQARGKNGNYKFAIAGLAESLSKLMQAVDGREIQLHIHARSSSFRNGYASVLVRGDARDNFNGCVASGGARTLRRALENALWRWELVAKSHQVINQPLDKKPESVWQVFAVGVNKRSKLKGAGVKD